MSVLILDLRLRQIPFDELAYMLSETDLSPQKSRFIIEQLAVRLDRNIRRNEFKLLAGLNKVLSILEIPPPLRPTLAAEVTFAMTFIDEDLMDRVDQILVAKPFVSDIIEVRKPIEDWADTKLSQRQIRQISKNRHLLRMLLGLEALALSRDLLLPSYEEQIQHIIYYFGK